jgi:hypothetical protein
MNTANTIATDLYPLLVKSRQLRFMTYLTIGHRLRSKADNSDPHPGANGTWVTLYYQDMGYSFRRRAAGFLPRGNA